jgi:hypothetical protein
MVCASLVLVHRTNLEIILEISSSDTINLQAVSHELSSLENQI